MVDPQRDFWMRETGTGQHVAQLHEILMMMIMKILRLSSQLEKIVFVATVCRCQRYKMYLRHVKFPTFLFDFSQVGGFLDRSE